MKKFFGFIFFCCLLSSLCAIDIGGSLNTSGFVFDENLVPTEKSIKSISEEATLWVKIPFSKSIGLLTEGSYEASYDFNKLSHKLDLSFLTLQMSFNPSSIASLDVDLGRFHTADFSSLVFNTFLDGLRLAFSLPEVDFEIYGGYTGFLNNNNANILYSSNFSDNSSLYPLASKFVAAGFSLEAKNLFGGHTFGTDLSSFISLDSSEARKSSFYVGINLTGPIFQSLYYKLTSTVSFLTEEPLQTGVLASGDLTFYPGFLASSIVANVTFATDTFCPFNEPGIVFDGSKTLQGVLKTGLSFSMKPLQTFLIALNCDYIMDVEKSSFLQNAVQWGLSSKVYLLSDIMFNLYAGQKLSLAKDGSSSFVGSASLVVNF